MRPERDSPPWTKTIAELRSLTDAELEEQHDGMVLEHGPTAASLNYYLNEIARRDVARRERRMEWLTWSIGAMTLVNVAVIVVDVA